MPKLASTRNNIKPSAMPSRLPPPSAKTLSKYIDSLFYCPSCSLWRSSPNQRFSSPRRREIRRASTLVSSTAVNATKTIPPTLETLYAALNEAKSKAAGHISLGRLQLALRGLESTDPVTRVGGMALTSRVTVNNFANGSKQFWLFIRRRLLGKWFNYYLPIHYKE